MGQSRENQQTAIEQNLIDAQIDFLETILSLDQLLIASTANGTIMSDSTYRANAVMDAIRTGTNDDAVDEWERKYDQQYIQIIQMEDEAERDEALAAWNEARRKDLIEIIAQAAERGHAVGAKVDLALRQINARPTPDDLIRRAVLVALASALEGVIGKLYRVALQVKPELYMSSDRKYSLPEILQPGALESIVEAAIESKVDAALRGGIEDWERLFTTLGVHFKQLCLDWHSLIEVFQRRNAFVHTHGAVNRSYAEKVKNAPPTGTPLKVDQAYLHRSIDQVAALGVLATVRMWLQLYPKSHFLATGVPYLYLDELLREGYWSAVEKIAGDMKGLDNNLDIKFRMRVYSWLARKNLHGVPSVRSEVEAWDTSALQSEFSFLKAILLDEFDEADKIVAQARRQSEPWVKEVRKMAAVRFYQPAWERFGFSHGR